MFSPHQSQDVVAVFDVAVDLVLSEETQSVATECLQEAHVWVCDIECP